MLLLELTQLSCTVAGVADMVIGRKRRTLLNDINLKIEQNTIVGLLGGSGTGKSTLARCVAGLHRPDGGTMVFDGTPVFPDSRNRSSIGLAIQMLFQSSGSSLDPLRSIGDTLFEAVDAAGLRGEDRMRRVRELLSAVGLSDEHLQRKPHQLSGGQRQRVAIARVLAVRPRLLILDEPTSSLDSMTQARVLTLLRSLKNAYGFAVLFITHDVPLALSLCDRIAILYEGTIIEQGASQDIQLNPRHSYTQELLRASMVSSASTHRARV